MGGAGEEVHGGGPLDTVALAGEAFDVPGQGGGVAGDVNHPLRGHLGDGGRDLLRQPLPGRIHGDDMGADAFGGEAGRHVGGVAAEELRVGKAVPGGVLLGVGDGLRDDLRPDDALGFPGETEGDGTRAAVEVHRRLLPGEGGKVQGQAVEDLGLGGIYLIEGGDRQAEGETTHLVHQVVLAPQGAVGLPQDHVGLFLVDPQDHALQTGLRRPEGPDQLLLAGEGLAVAEQAAKALPGPVDADIEVAEKAPAGALVVGGDMAGGHVVLQGPAEAGARLGLEETVLHVGDGVGPGGVEADGGPGDGELGLVPITPGIFRAVYNRDRGITAADAGETVLDLLPFELQLFVIGHVAEGAAAACFIVRAVGLTPGGGGGLHGDGMAPGAGFPHLVQLDKAGLPPEGSGDKGRHAVGQAGHPLALRAVALDGEGEGRREFVFFHGRDLLAGWEGPVRTPAPTGWGVFISLPRKGPGVKKIPLASGGRRKV